ncbi:lipase [Mycoplasmopsis californica]|nr:lipase [Mycoplasmopsis californica]
MKLEVFMSKRVLKTASTIIGILSATIALAVGISFIPKKEKQLVHSAEVNPQKNLNDNVKIPTLEKKSKDYKRESLTKFDHKDPVKLENRLYSPNVIKASEQVKYVALGDSITAGFVAFSDKDYPGNFENNSVKGLSYPAYIASFFNDLGRLESFENFGVSGTTFIHWNLLLKSQGKANKLTDSELKIVESKFGINWTKKYNRLIQQLTNSNLITVSLGANDFMHTISVKIGEFPFSKIIEYINTKNPDYTEISKIVSDLFNDLFTNIEKNQTEFIGTIKKIAPKANINFIAFPTPLSTIIDLIDRHINNYSENVSFSLSTVLIDLINNKIKYTANSNGVYFINPFDAKYWVQNHRILSNTLFDIHPGAKGYKRMAQDIFIKLVNPSRDQTEYIKNGIEWNNDYFLTDSDSFLTQIKLKDAPFATILKLFGPNVKDYVLADDQRYLQYSKTFNKQNYFRRVLDNVGLEKIIFERVLPTFFESDFYSKIDPKHSLKNFLYKNNKEHLKSLKSWMSEQKIVATLLQNVEQQFWQKDWDNDGLPGAKITKLNYLLSAFKTEISNEQKIISYIFSLTQTSPFKNDLNEFKTIIKNILTNFVNFDLAKEKISSIIDLIYKPEWASFISKSDSKKLLLAILNANSVKQAIVDIVVNVIEDSQNFAKNKTFRELWFTFINNPKNKTVFKNLLSSVLQDLVQNTKFLEVVQNVSRRTIETYPDYFEGVNHLGLSELIIDLIRSWNNVDQLFGISKVIAETLLSQLKAKLPNEIDFRAFSSQLNENLSKKLKATKPLDASLILIKSIINTDLPKHSQTVRIIIKNLINSVKKDKITIQKITELIYSKLPKNLSNSVNLEQFNSAIQSIVILPEFEDLITSFLDDISTIDKNKIAKINSISEIIFEIVKNNSKTITAVLKLISKSIDIQEIHSVITNLITKNLKDQTYTQYVPQFLAFAKDLLNQNIVHDLAQNFVKNSLAELASGTDTKSIEKILNNWLKNSEQQKFIKEKIIELLKTNATSQSLIDLLSTFTHNALTKLAPDNGISKDEIKEFLTSLLAKFDKLESKTQIFSKLFDILVSEITKDTKQLNWAEFGSQIATNLLGDKVIDLVKFFVQEDILTQQSEFIKKIINLGLKYVTNNQKIAKYIYVKMGDKSRELIEKHMNSTDFVRALSDTFTKSQNQINEILDLVFAIIKKDKEAIIDIKNIFDLIKIALKDQSSREQIQKIIEDLITNLISTDGIFKLLNGLWKDSITPYGVDVETEANKKFVSDLYQELPQLIKDLGLVKHVLDALNSTAQTNTDTSTFGAELVKNIIQELDFKNYKYAQVLLKSKTLATHNETLKSNISKLIESVTSKDENVQKFSNDFKITDSLVELGLSPEDALETAKSAFKSNELKTILDLFINELFAKTEQYSNLETWPKAVATVFKSIDQDKIKQPLTSWIKSIFTKNEKIAYALGKIMAQKLRESGVKIPKQDDITIQKFIHSFLKAAVETKILENIVSEILEVLKKVDTFKPNEIKQKILDAFKTGGTKFIMDGDTIMLGKIFDNIDLFESIFSKLDTKAYSDFLNLMFKYSPQDKTKGIYGAMYGASKSQFNASSGISGLIQGKASKFIKVFVKPLAEQYFKELSETEKIYATVEEMKQQSSAYQSLWRFYAFFARMMYGNTNPKWLFWNGTNLTAEAILMSGFTESFKEAIEKHKELLNKYKSKLDIIGFNDTKQPLDYWIAGTQLLVEKGWFGRTTTYNSRSNNLSASRYGRDHTLVYIYYGDKIDTKYNKGKKMEDILLEDMIRGYQPVKNK